MIALTQTKPLLTVREVAEILGLSRPRTYELIAQGVVPSIRLSERGTRVPAAALNAYIAALAEQAIDNLGGGDG